MDAQEVDREAQNLASNLNEIEKSQNRFNFHIAKPLKFPLIWLCFFAVIGIIIQSLQAHTFVFFKFFGSNFINWISSLGTFTNVRYYSNTQEVIQDLGRGWYYFFFAGGILSLIWGILSWFMHSEVRVKKQEEIQF